MRCEADREPLSLVLVLDRSGSMQGQKLDTAKRAAEAVIDRLEERDRVAIVVFDDRIDVVQQTVPATREIKARIRSALAEIAARSMTALHEGWLTGCRAIADDTLPALDAGLARCFLLTDGLANVGLTDPEQIAREAAGIRENAHIGTSTFGIGPDYDEALLGPMAVAGGGQFHHLRTASEIAHTFVGELGELLAVAASQVRVELEVDPAVDVAVISEYWLSQGQTEPARWSVMVGDLLAGEERHIVVRFGFPPDDRQRDGYAVRSRIAWISEGQEHRSVWQDVWFAYADHETCSAEVKDPDVMHWVGLHHVQRAKREATEESRRGDQQAARQTLKRVAQHVAACAGVDQALLAEVAALAAMENTLASRAWNPQEAKEVYYAAQLRSRGHRDHRGS